MIARSHPLTMFLRIAQQEEIPETGSVLTRNSIPSEKLLGRSLTK